MDDLISRQAAVDAVTMEGCGMCAECIKDIPAAQQDRKVGEWQITDAYPHNVYCSVCHKRFAQTHWAVWEDGSLPRNYCPNCGAKMEG